MHSSCIQYHILKNANINFQIESFIYLFIYLDYTKSKVLSSLVSYCVCLHVVFVHYLGCVQLSCSQYWYDTLLCTRTKALEALHTSARLHSRLWIFRRGGGVWRRGGGRWRRRGCRPQHCQVIRQVWRWVPKTGVLIWKVISLCKIWRSHSGAAEDSSSLGCDTVLFGK